MTKDGFRNDAQIESGVKRQNVKHISYAHSWNRYFSPRLEIIIPIISHQLVINKLNNIKNCVYTLIIEKKKSFMEKNV